MQLSVHPDDLAASAAALRSAAAALESARAEFEAAASRLTPSLGPHAADSASATLAVASRGIELVEGDVASFSRGLMAAAAYYNAMDGHALGRVTVQR